MGALKEKVCFSVPTGNFGDIFAGYVAKKMGLPIDKLVIATNENDILHRALETGVYEKKGLRQTMSPSMDIQIASNFERIIFDICDGDSDQVIHLMEKLTRDGKFILNPELLKRLRNDFMSYSVTEGETVETINAILKSHEMLVCPHTAVGINAAENIKKSGSKMITLATAHPAKFPNAVKNASGVIPKLPKKHADIFSKGENLTYAPNSLVEIQKIISERIT